MGFGCDSQSITSMVTKRSRDRNNATKQTKWIFSTGCWFRTSLPPLSVEVYKHMENSANGLRLLLTDDLGRFKGLRSLRSLTCAPLTSLVAATGGSTNKSWESQVWGLRWLLLFWKTRSWDIDVSLRASESFGEKKKACQGYKQCSKREPLTEIV